MARKTTPDLRSILAGGSAPAAENPKPKPKPKEKKETTDNPERKERNLSTDSGDKVKFTTGLSNGTVERLRDAAWWARESVAAIVERAIMEEIKRMEKAQGSPFPVRSEELRRGRPMK